MTRPASLRYHRSWETRSTASHWLNHRESRSETRTKLLESLRFWWSIGRLGRRRRTSTTRRTHSSSPLKTTTQLCYARRLAPPPNAWQATGPCLFHHLRTGKFFFDGWRRTTMARRARLGDARTESLAFIGPCSTSSSAWSQSSDCAGSKSSSIWRRYMRVWGLWTHCGLEHRLRDRLSATATGRCVEQPSDRSMARLGKEAAKGAVDGICFEWRSSTGYLAVNRHCRVDELQADRFLPALSDYAKIRTTRSRWGRLHHPYVFMVAVIGGRKHDVHTSHRPFGAHCSSRQNGGAVGHHHHGKASKDESPQTPKSPRSPILISLSIVFQRTTATTDAINPTTFIRSVVTISIPLHHPDKLVRRQILPS